MFETITLKKRNIKSKKRLAAKINCMPQGRLAREGWIPPKEPRTPTTPSVLLSFSLFWLSAKTQFQNPHLFLLSFHPMLLSFCPFLPHPPPAPTLLGVFEAIFFRYKKKTGTKQNGGRRGKRLCFLPWKVMTTI